MLATNLMSQREKSRMQRLIRNMGWKMTTDERRELMQLLIEKTTGRIFPHRIDRSYRRIYGYGDKPRKITVSYGQDEPWAIMEQGGRCWLEHEGLRVE